MSYIWDSNNKDTYDNRLGHYKFRKEYGFIKNVISKLDIANILDIGGGSGRFAIPLSESYKDITVVDVNNEAIKILKSRNENILTICDDFLKCGLTNNHYDLILCIEVLVYFIDSNEFFKKVKDLISDNGIFIFTFVNTNSWRYLIRDLRKNKTTYNYLSFEKLNKILELNNLEIMKAEGLNWMPLPLSYKGFLVSLFEKVESVFRLNQWIAQSPWIMYAVKKKKT